MKTGKLLTVAFFLMYLVSIQMNAQDKLQFIVAQDGSGDYSTIQSAIDACKAFPDARIKVFIKNGLYHEKIRIPACNTQLSLIGESIEKTIISFDDYFDKMGRGRNSTFYTYTLMVEANDFFAENLTIENTAGPIGQAVALHIEGDRCIIKNCRILGNQDTLYTAGQNCRQVFDSCYIEGTTDFIFGAATALFSHCTICSKTNSYITAASTPKGKPFGYVFINCKLIAYENVNKVYLGRPWRDYAKVVYLYCEIGSHIVPEGWVNWDKTSRDKTAYYAEYNNTGTGSNTDQRVSWSHQLSKEESAIYTMKNILAPILPEEPAITQWNNNLTL